jgi:hypothetical protein
VHRGLEEKSGRLAVEEAKGVGVELGHRTPTVWASITSPLVSSRSRLTHMYLFTSSPRARLVFSGAQLLGLPPLHLLLLVMGNTAVRVQAHHGKYRNKSLPVSS